MDICIFSGVVPLRERLNKSAFDLTLKVSDLIIPCVNSVIVHINKLFTISHVNYTDINHSKIKRLYLCQEYNFIPKKNWSS